MLARRCRRNCEDQGAAERSPAQVIRVTEMPGVEFPSLEAAQQAVRPVLASILADEIRRMLKTGELEIRDGFILPAGKRS